MRTCYTVRMSLFGTKHGNDRYGVIIDIGSGSVLTAIVHSNSELKHPHIVWAHREHAPLRNIDSLEQSAKAVMTALINASMLLDAEGRKALYDYSSSARLTEIQCGVSAPWSYTVTKTIDYQQKEPFLVTEELIDELLQTINEKFESDLKENEALTKLGLQVITRSTIEMLSNGYRVKHPEGNEASQLTVSRVSVVSQQYLVDALEELRDKLFPEADSHKLSFILMLYSVTRELLSKTYDFCLVDVTYEATEIGIVRDGVLSYCTHTPFGSFSLAREISKVTNVPLHEAFGYLHSPKPYSFLSSLSKQQRDDIEMAFDAYTARVSDVFKETGDELTIPKKISLHVDVDSEPLFSDLIEKAAKRSIKAEPQISLISKEILQQKYTVPEGAPGKKLPADTALLMSAQFFHMQARRGDFEYL